MRTSSPPRLAQHLVPLATALLCGCTAPVGFIVPGEVVRNLSTDTLPPFDRSSFGAQVRDHFGLEHIEPEPWVEDDWRRFDAPELMSGVRDGDLLLVKSRKAQSLATTVGLARPTWFTHSGILEHTPAGVVVHESWPAVALWTKTDTFVERFQGGTRTTPVLEFLARYHHGQIVRPPGDAAARLVRARELVARNIPFDSFHDPARPDLTCTEFCAVVMEVDLPIVPISAVESINATQFALGWYVQGFQTPGLLADEPGTVAVGELGRHRSAEEVASLRATWQEIHRMSQRPGSSMGDWVGYDRFKLFRMRPRSEALLCWSVALERAGIELSHAERARVLVKLSLRQ
ncbi:MAG: hypothetical protein O2816_03335 [Planctomycetota bacterium]|nr:hypothetical protein [Planctomycetota bacterium]